MSKSGPARDLGRPARGPELTEAPTDALGAYLRRLDARPLLTASQERRLASLARGGCRRSREELVVRNLRLVVSVAKAHRGRGLPFEDLIQEGNAGLLRAVERFDPGRGFRFSTYATWWVRQGMRRAIANKGRAIRIPVHVHDRRGKVHAARQALLAATGTEPAPEAIAARARTSVGEVLDLFSLPEDPVSLDAPLSPEEDRDADFLSLLPSPTDLPDEEALCAMEAAARRGRLLGALRALPHRERHVVRALYGLDGHEPRRQVGVAEELGISAERVRQLRILALAKIRELLDGTGDGAA